MNLGVVGEKTAASGSQHIHGWMVGMAVTIGVTVLVALILAGMLLKRRYRVVRIGAGDSIRSSRLSNRSAVEMASREVPASELSGGGDASVELPAREIGKRELPIIHSLQEKDKEKPASGWVWV